MIKNELNMQVPDFKIVPVDLIQEYFSDASFNISSLDISEYIPANDNNKYAVRSSGVGEDSVENPMAGY